MRRKAGAAQGDESILLPGCPITDADLREVWRHRHGMLAMGYEPLVINSPWSGAVFDAGRGKAPIGKEWQKGHSSFRLFNQKNGHWSRAGANTGLLLGVTDEPVQAFDLDIDDRKVVSQVCGLLDGVVPYDALVRSRPGSERMVLLARCEPGAVKRKLRGSLGGFERLALGQQVVVDGWHTAGGRLAWQAGRAPWEVPAWSLPMVPEEAVEALFGLLVASGVLGEKIDQVARRPGTGDGAGHAPEGDIAARIRDLVKAQGDVVGGIRAAIDEAGAAGGYRHDTLVSCAGHLIARRWPKDEARALLLPACDDAFGEGSWEAEVDAALAHAEKRQRSRLRGLFTSTAKEAADG
jgi:hypothetical protein